ncbi:hypothetical protein Tco_1328764 [Tanacetum coccineum]
MAFGGNKCDLGSFREETDEITDLYKILEEVLLTRRGDGVANIKRRRRDPSSDGVRRFSNSVRTYGYSSVEGDLRKFSDIGAWVQVPRCMAWLDYDEHVDSLSTMDNKVGVTSPESTTQTLPSFEEYTPPMTYPKEVEKTLGTLIEEMYDDDWGLESKEVFPLRKELCLFDRPNKVEKGRILEAHRLESIIQQQISQRMAPSHHDGCYVAFCTGKQLIRMSEGNFSSKTKNEFLQSVEMASQVTRDTVTTTPMTGSGYS